MKALITGVAGFIGSSIAMRLIQDGYQVRGVDGFIDTYPREQKQANLKDIESCDTNSRFEWVEANLLKYDLDALLNGCELVFHHAGLAGIRESWGKDFAQYTDHNILATQQLLEAAIDKPIKRFVYASSSSIYGEHGPVELSESQLPQPLSPYGVSKLAAEHLCHLYWKNFKVPTISLRYFTVYGPRQRPEMAFHHFLQAIYQKTPLNIFGDGQQTRDFTYIEDVVEANMQAISNGEIGEAYNIGGGNRMILNHVIELMENIVGNKAELNYLDTAKGDVLNTAADCSKAKKALGYKPKYPVEDGLKRMAGWVKAYYEF